MGHLAMDSLWQQALHQNSVFIFNIALAGLERVVVSIVPYQVHRNGRADSGNRLTSQDLKQRTKDAR
jgi:hypothetical protein